MEKIYHLIFWTLLANCGLKSHAAETTKLPDYDRWALKIEPVEFRGGNHNEGKSVSYQVRLDMVSVDRGAKNPSKSEKKVLEVSPIQTDALAWRIPNEDERNNLSMVISGEDFRKSMAATMASLKIPEEQIKLEIKLSAFKKPWIPYVKKPEFLGSVTIDPETELTDGGILQKEIPLGQGGLLRFRVLATGLKPKK